MSAGRPGYSHIISVEIGDVIKQSCRCNQVATGIVVVASDGDEPMRAVVRNTLGVLRPEILLVLGVIAQEKGRCRPALLQENLNRGRLIIGTNGIIIEAAFEMGLPPAEMGMLGQNSPHIGAEVDGG